MNARTALVLLALSLIPGRAQAGSVDKAKLRKLAKLPEVGVVVGVGFSTTFGCSFNGDKPDPLAEIARLRKQLKGDPSDVERYLRLGRLYSKAERKKESEEAYAKAVSICRQQVREHPDDMRWLAQLGDALVSNDEIDEGEKLLRRAVKEAPNEWRAWLALGECVDGRAVHALFGDKGFTFHLLDAKVVIPQLLEKKPTAKQIADMRRMRKEARRCYDRAIELAPREVKPYFRRIGSNWIHALLDAGLRAVKGEKVNYGGRGPYARVRRRHGPRRPAGARRSENGWLGRADATAGLHPQRQA
ncbi:MAG TPA: tetratricopeptide repeat protein [Gemmataceae bacterium]|jgi:tetratricopeptide (TPR) repeat protein